MKNAFGFHASRAVCALLASGLWATLSYGAVTADPAKTTFTSPQQAVTIKLSNDGAPIAAKDIRGWQFIASGHDYKHMITVEKSDGALKVSPSKTMEVGSYDLNIETAQGPVTVRVLAPLNDAPGVVEKLAALTGESEQKVAVKLGLATISARSEVHIDLPPVYYEGQTLELTMPAKANSGRTCAWFINGNSVAEGVDQFKLTYTFKESGDYVVTYLETEKEDGKLVTVAHARAFTRVALVPAVAVEVAANTEMEYSSPPGYRKFVWRTDGKEVSSEPILKQTFQAAGPYVVECLASAPKQGPEQGFMRTRYNTTVTSK